MWWKKNRRGEPDPHTARLEGDWSGLLEDLEGDPANHETLRRARTWGRRRGIFIAPDRAMRAAVPAMVSTLREGFELHYGAELAASLSRARAVATLSDDPCAQTNVRRDPPVISVSSGFMTCGAMLSGAWDVLASGTDPDEAYASLAVLRFYALQQVMFGLSATHAPRKVTAAGPDFATFTLAHEMAHVALCHAVTPTEAAHQELEADRFAWPVMRLAGVFNRAAAVDSALLGLITADFIGRYPYVRPPASHPPLAARIDNLGATDPAIAQRGAQVESMVRLAHDASDLTRPLPTAAWDALDASRYWETGRRHPSVYANIRHYDAMLGLDRDMLLDCLEQMRQGRSATLRFAPVLAQVTTGSAGDLVAAAAELGLEDTDLWLAPDAPVGLDLLVEEFATCPAWDEVPGRGTLEDRVIESTLAALVVRSHLLDTGEDSNAG